MGAKVTSFLVPYELTYAGFYLQEFNGYENQPPMPPNILFRTPPSTHFPPLMVNRMFTLFEGWSRSMAQVRNAPAHSIPTFV